MELYDVTTGESWVPEQSADYRKAIEAGTHTLKKSQRPVIYNPKNPKERYDIPATEVQNALSEGFEIETPAQTAVQEYLKENKGIIGDLKVAGGEFANQLLFSVPEIVYRNTADPLEWAKVNALREERDLASALGIVGGIGANITALARAGYFNATEEIAEKAVNVFAKRIQATLGKGVSEQAAKQAAKGILSKTAQKVGQAAKVIPSNIAKGAIEGGIDMAVPAAAEAAFGNYDEAAEALMLGATFGGILGGGIRTAGDGLSALKRSAIDEAKASEYTLKAFSNITNTDIEDLRYALKNPQKVANAATDEDNVRKMMQIMDGEERMFNDAIEAEKLAKQQLDTDWSLQQKKFEERAKAPNAELAAAFEEDIGKAWDEINRLGELSNTMLAEDIPNPIFPKAQLFNAIDDEISKLRVGKGPRKAKADLERLKTEIDELYDDVLNGVELREIVQNVRRDVNFDGPVNQFDKPYDAAIKNISKSWQDELKYLSGNDRYAKVQADMAPILEALNDITPLANTPENLNNLASALAATKPTKPQQAIQRKVEQFKYALKNLGEGFEGIDSRYEALLSNTRNARSYSDRIATARKDKTGKAQLELMQEISPAQVENYNLAKANAEEARSVWNRIKVFKGDPENKFRRLGFKRANVALEDGLDEIIKRNSGVVEGAADLADNIKHRNVLNSLLRVRTQGSRNVNLLSTIMSGGAGAFGSALGAVAGGATGLAAGPVIGFMGLAAGGALGGYLDRFAGENIVKNLLSDSSQAQFHRALLLAESNLGDIARKYDKIPKIITKIADGNFLGGKDRTGAIQKLNRFIGAMMRAALITDKEYKGKASEVSTNGDQIIMEAKRNFWRVMLKRVSELGTPDGMQASIGAMMSDVSEGGAPNIAAKMADKMVNSYQYVNNIIPKPPSVDSPFDPDYEYTPPDFDIDNFVNQMSVLYDPMIVFDNFEAGLLTKAHVQALEAVYPALYERMTRKVMDTFSDRKIKMEYNDKIQLSYILGMPLDRTMSAESFSYYQSSFAADEQQVASQGGGANYKQTKINIDTGSYQTLTQRLESRA